MSMWLHRLLDFMHSQHPLPNGSVRSGEQRKILRVKSYHSFFSVKSFSKKPCGKEFDIPESDYHDVNVARALDEVGIDPIYAVFFDLLPCDNSPGCAWQLSFSVHLAKFTDSSGRFKPIITELLAKDEKLLLYVAQQVMELVVMHDNGFKFEETYPSKPFWYFIYGLSLAEKVELNRGVSTNDLARVKKLNKLLNSQYLERRFRGGLGKADIPPSEVSQKRWIEFKHWLADRFKQPNRAREQQVEFLKLFLQIVLCNERQNARLHKALFQAPLTAFDACLQKERVHWKSLMQPNGFARLARLSWQQPAAGEVSVHDVWSLELMANDSRAIFCECLDDGNKDFNVLRFSSANHLLSVAWYLQRHILLLTSFSRSVLQPGSLEARFYLPAMLQVHRPRPSYGKTGGPLDGQLQAANQPILTRFLLGSSADAGDQAANPQLLVCDVPGGAARVLGAATPAAQRGGVTPGALDQILTLNAAAAEHANTLLVLQPSDIRVFQDRARQNSAVIKCCPANANVNLPSRLVIKKLTFPNWAKASRLLDLANQTCGLSCPFINPTLGMVMSANSDLGFGLVSELRLSCLRNLLSSEKRKHDFTAGHLLRVAYQCLSALLYLIGQPRAGIRYHNNIKLTNILVEFFDQDDIHIRLCDLVSTKESGSSSRPPDLSQLGASLKHILDHEGHSTKPCEVCEPLTALSEQQMKAAPRHDEDGQLEDRVLLDLLDAVGRMLADNREMRSHALVAAGNTKLVGPTASDTPCDWLGYSEVPDKLQLNPSDLVELPNQKLGSGHYGDVIQGVLTNAGGKEKVAVKQLKADPSADGHRRFIKEVLTQYNLPPHPNILKLLRVEEGSRKLITPLMSLSLEKFLNANRTSLRSEKCLRFLKQIADGMKFLSEHKVFHCDLATRNVLLDNDNATLKIADFGLAGIFNPGAESQDEYYRVPSKQEMPFLNLPPTDIQLNKIFPTTDSWSYGIVVWEMFNDVTVAIGMQSQGIENAQKDLLPHVEGGGRILPLGRVPKCLHELVDRCWEPKHEKRISLAKIFEEVNKLGELR